MCWIDQMILIIGTIHRTIARFASVVAAMNIGQVESTPAHSVSDVDAVCAGSRPIGDAPGGSRVLMCRVPQTVRCG
jgi:hypothetical protein